MLNGPRLSDCVIPPAKQRATPTLIHTLDRNNSTPVYRHTPIGIQTEVSVKLTEYAQTDEATEIHCSILANDMEPWKPDFELLRRAQEDTPGGDADMEFFRHTFGLSRPDPGRRRFRISKARIDSYKQRRATVEVDVASLQALEAAVRQLEQTVAALVPEEAKRSTDGDVHESGGGA
jgi:hypothetical protein